MINENELKQIKEKICEIEENSADGGYIYRGERKTYKGKPYFGKVSSSLWREYRSKDLDIERVQQEILKNAKKHIGQLPNDYRPSRSIFNAPPSNPDALACGMSTADNVMDSTKCPAKAE